MNSIQASQIMGGNGAEANVGALAQEKSTVRFTGRKSIAERLRRPRRTASARAAATRGGSATWSTARSRSTARASWRADNG